MVADRGPEYADAMSRALWYALGIAVLSVVAMLLLPRMERERPPSRTAARVAQASWLPS